MKQLAWTVAAVAVFLVLQSGAAVAGATCSPGTVDQEAGPIWDNEDAKTKCPATCEKNNGSWNGQWRTTEWGKMSVCGCQECCKDVEAGPIWNNDDARGKCPAVCEKANGTWNGQWVTTVPGEMSVCGCCGNLCKRAAKDEEAGPIWDNDDAQKKCPRVCADKGGTWNGQWRTTEWGKMSVCGCVECSG